MPLPRLAAGPGVGEAGRGRRYPGRRAARGSCPTGARGRGCARPRSEPASRRGHVAGRLGGSAHGPRHGRAWQLGGLGAPTPTLSRSVRSVGAKQELGTRPGFSSVCQVF